MNYKLIPPEQGQLPELIEIRIAAMKPSLEAVERFDPVRATKRFTSGYDPEKTTCIVIEDVLVGFYVLLDMDEHLLLDHFYIKPEAQGGGLGTSIIDEIKNVAKQRDIPVVLGALRGSKSNDFYKRNGFVKTHESDFDIHYRYKP